jgi:hypothetical protein
MATDAKPTPRPTRSGLKVLAGGIGLLLVLYVLSAGPVGRLPPPISPLGQPDDYWEVAYAPLLWVTDRSSSANSVARWYLQACGANEAASLVGARHIWHALDNL